MAAADGVVKRRRFSAVRYRGHLGELVGHPSLETFPEVPNLDLSERWQLVWELAGGEERIGRRGRGSHVA